ncbi:MAG: hypothetical protein AB1416_06980 [Actinomycetota bacterium]
MRGGRHSGDVGTGGIPRLLLLVAALALGALAVLSLTAPVRAAPPEKPIPGSIVVETKTYPSGALTRCNAVPFLEFGEVAGATGYRATVGDTVLGRRTFTGPPFPDDDLITSVTRFTAPAGTHRFGLAGFHGPDGSCAAAEAAYTARFSVIEVIAIGATSTGAIEGNVKTTPRLDAVPGVAIAIAGVSGEAAGKRASATTDAGGGYRVEGLAEGGYTVTPTVAPDLEVTPASHKVTVTAGQTARADFRVKPASALKVTITADPKSPFVEQRVKGPLPEPVRFTVKVTNTGKGAIQNVTLPEKLTVGRLSHPYKVLEQGAADPRNPKRRTGLPRPEALKLGTLRPGQSKALTYRYEADGDGTVSVEALAIGSAGRRRVVGRGELVMRIGTQLLVVTADEGRSTPSPQARDLILAGTPFSVDVTIDNRSNDRPALVLPALEAARGNLRGGLWRKHAAAPLDLFVARSQQEDPPLFIARVAPRKSLRLDLVFVTDASSYTFDPVAERTGGARRSAGGTRAELVVGRPGAMAPPETDVDAPVEKWVNVQEKLIVRPKDRAALRYSIDDRGMTARPWNRWTGPGIAYAEFSLGQVQGYASWVWGTVRAIIFDLPALVGKGVAGLPSAAVKYTEQGVALWEQIKDDPAARQEFLNRLQAALLTQGGSELQKFAARQGPKFWQAINDAVLADMTRMHAEWYAGDWRAAARSGGVATGQITLDVATAPVIEAHALRWARGAKLAVLSRTSAAVDGLRLAAKAHLDEVGRVLDARIAAVRRLGADEALDILRNVVTPARVGIGFRFADHHLPALFGLTRKQAEWLRDFARRNKVLITIRSRASESIAWLRRNAVLKPEDIKTKNVNHVDVAYLGYDKSDIGRVIVPLEKPPDAAELNTILRKKGVKPGSKEWESAHIRRQERTDEWAKEQATWRKWDRDGRVDFEWNWKGNAVDPTKAPDIPATRAKFKLVPEPAPPRKPRKLVPMVDLEDGAGYRSITGDVDTVGLTDIDGRPLPDEVYARLLKEMRDGPVGAMHPTTDTWTKNGDFWFPAKEKQLQPGECCFAQFGPDGEARAVSLDLGKSLVKPPFDRVSHYLHWAGGYRATVGAHPKRVPDVF